MLKADKNFFARLVLAQARQLNLKTILAYPLGPLPWALASTYGSLAKTNKATLLCLLEADTSPVENVPPAVWLVDGMALLQALPTGKCEMFADISKLVLRQVLSAHHRQAGRVDLVMDCYRAGSIKSLERERRSGSDGGVCIRITNRQQKCPRQWSRYLRVSQNKDDLVRFLEDEWKRPEYAELFLQSQCMLYVSAAKCFKFCAVIRNG